MTKNLPIFHYCFLLRLVPSSSMTFVNVRSLSFFVHQRMNLVVSWNVANERKWELQRHLLRVFVLQPR